MPAEIDLLPVQLPGRENRFSEPRLSSMQELLPLLHRGLSPYLDKPFVFFGHSLGALIAFELARLLRRSGGPEPAHLFVAAFRGPRLPNEHPVLHTLPDARFIEAFLQFEGVPEEVAQHRELLELVAAIAKKDFQLHETYHYQPGEKLACPITAFGGDQDPFILPGMLDAWAEETSGTFKKNVLPGGHHFVHQHAAAIKLNISDCLRAGASHRNERVS